MQKQTKYIILLSVAIGALIPFTIIQFINARNAYGELDRIGEQATATIKQARKSEQQAIEKANSLKKQLLKTQGTINELSSNNTEITKTANSIDKDVDEVKGIAEESRNVIKELRKSIQ